jgi:YgiT-type zinc finger domain-containing protein
MSAERVCVHCGSDAIQVKHVTRSFDKGAALLVVEAIPMSSCSNCGESYFSARAMHELERIKALRSSVAVTRSVAVATFA